MTAQDQDPLTQPPLIEFPCFFPIKIMGETSETFKPTIQALIQTYVPIFSDDDIETRHSSTAKYISLTCHVWVESQTQLDDVYRAVTSHPLVKYTI